MAGPGDEIVEQPTGDAGDKSEIDTDDRSGGPADQV
jgi:hypothetical protein